MKKVMNVNLKKISFVLTSILLVFIPDIVLAAGIQMQSFSIPSSDLSVAFLARIFGTVGGGLVGVGPTVFGQIFYVFNYGILMIAGVFLTFTTGRSIVEIANADAGQMARKFSWWVPARVVLGVGLLVPQPTGYSTLNTLVMWVTLQGVGLADAVWSQAIDFLQKGGALYVPLKLSNDAGTADQIDKKLVDSFDIGSSGGQGVGVSSILRSQICMKTLYNRLDKSRQAYALRSAKQLSKTKVIRDNVVVNDPLSGGSTVLPTFSEVCDDSPCTFDTKSGTAPGTPACVFKFPCNADKYINDTNNANVPFVKSLKASLTALNQSMDGICGAYTWSPVKPGDGAQNYGDDKKTGLKQVILGFDQFADDAVNKYKDDVFDAFIKDDAVPNSDPYTDGSVPSDFGGFSQQMYQTLVAESGAYQATIYPIRLFASNGYSTHDINAIYSCTKDKDGKENCGWAVPKGVSPITKHMLEQGWIVAGSYYFSLMSVKTADNKGEDSFYRFYIYNNMSPPYCDTKDHCTVSQGLSSILRDAGGDDSVEKSLTKRLKWVGYQNTFGVDRKAYALIDELNKAAVGSSSVSLPKELQDFVGKKQVRLATGAYVFTSIFLDPVNEKIQDVFCLWGLNLGLSATVLSESCGYGQSDVTKASLMSPIERLQTLGQKMIDNCVSIWTHLFSSMTTMLASFYAISVAGSITGIALAPFTFWSAASGGVMAAQIIMSLVQESAKFFFEMPFTAALPIISAVSMLMLSTGITLAYYIPLLPFMLFIFGAIGWLAFVIEAMVAAPLVALGITHPEGHDLMGKSEQGVMMLLSVFVRPSAMIIGLFSGMVVSYVALDVLNAGFGTIISALYYGGIGSASSSASGAVAQIRNSAMIIVYVLIAMSIVEQCFSLIHIIPTKIMHWIGVGAEAGMEGKLAEGVKGGLTGAAEKVGGSFTQGSKGSAGGAFSAKTRYGSKESEGDRGQQKEATVEPKDS